MLHLHEPSGTASGRVIILGANGFIAAAATRELATHGWAVRALSAAECDLTAPESVQVLADTITGNDSVLFTSAVTRENGNDSATLLRNLTMAHHVLLAIAVRGCRQLVYLSSDAVYGGHQEIITDTTPAEPDDMYGVMHLAREGMLNAAFRQWRSPLLVLRLSTVYGAGDTHANYGPNRFVRQIATSGALTLFGAGEEQRDHVYIDDVVGVIRRCLSHRASGSAIVATGRSRSFADIALVFRGLIGGDIGTNSRPRLIEFRHRQFMTRALLDAFPQIVWTPMEDGIRQQLAGHPRVEAL